MSQVNLTEKLPLRFGTAIILARKFDSGHRCSEAPAPSCLVKVELRVGVSRLNAVIDPVLGRAISPNEVVPLHLLEVVPNCSMRLGILHTCSVFLVELAWSKFAELFDDVVHFSLMVCKRFEVLLTNFLACTGCRRLDAVARDFVGVFTLCLLCSDSKRRNRDTGSPLASSAMVSSSSSAMASGISPRFARSLRMSTSSAEV